jgi:hypothetical protein
MKQDKTIIYLVMIIIIMRGENFVAHLDGLGGTPVAHYWNRSRQDSMAGFCEHGNEP